MLESTGVRAGVFLALALFIPGKPASADASSHEHLLDGVSFRYFYQSGQGVEMSFGSGRVSYRWIAGPPTGTGKVGVPYRSRRIGPERYVVAFRDLDRDSSDFVTLVLDFGSNTMAGSALLGYGGERERIHFEGGIIEDVKWERGARRPARPPS